MSQSIPKGLMPEHVLKAIADLDSGIDHPFGMPKQYLYRLFRFTQQPKVYVLHGALSSFCGLEPVTYRAIIGHGA